MSNFTKLFIGLITIVVIGSAVMMLTPPPNNAIATGYFDKFSKYKKPGKCDVPPTWGGVIPGDKRFVPTYVDEAGVAHAYCDRQTGIVLDAAPEFFEEGSEMSWFAARSYCLNRTDPWNGQKGGRLPSIAELASMVTEDSDSCNGGGPCLPNGNPFGDHVKNAAYWSASGSASSSDSAWLVVFGDGMVANGNKPDGNQVWCVRGPMSEDAY